MDVNQDAQDEYNIQQEGKHPARFNILLCSHPLYIEAPTDHYGVKFSKFYVFLNLREEFHWVKNHFR